MKRYFINQEGEANKFWAVEQTDSSFTVKFGKVGTKGRETYKELVDAAACRAEVARLIQEKLRKGYLELREGESIPAKPEVKYQPMDEDMFWTVIGLFNWKKTGDDDTVMLPALKKLASLPVEDIFAFEEILAEKLYKLDGEKYAAACYPGEQQYVGGQPYISADDFLYCRCCVVINGKQYYEHILGQPEDWPIDCEFESVLALAQAAYERKTKGAEYLYTTKKSYETYSNLEGWTSVG